MFEIVNNLDYFDAALANNEYNFDMGFVYDPFRIQSKLNILPLIRPIYSLYDSNVTGGIYQHISKSVFWCD